LVLVVVLVGGSRASADDVWRHRFCIRESSSCRFFFLAAITFSKEQKMSLKENDRQRKKEN
jgi:hypothetical protein